MYRYTTYGLDIASDLELPELVVAEDAPGDAEPDLRIRLGTTPEQIEDPAESRVVWSARPDEWLQTIDDVARYYIHDGGRDVIIERLGGTDADLRAFFFGTVIGALLHQRGLFVLHACTVVLPDGGAVAVAGTGGAGKSTTLAALIGRGHRVLTDDKTVVQFQQDSPVALSGYPTLRLWRDAAERIGADPDTLSPLRDGIEKYLYRTPAFQPVPAPLRALVVLNVGRSEEGSTDVTQTVIHGHDAIRTVLRQTYRRRIVNGSGFQAEHFQWAAKLANAVPVVRVTRPGRAETVEAVADAVEAAPGQASAGTPEG